MIHTEQYNHKHFFFSLTSPRPKINLFFTADQIVILQNRWSSDISNAKQAHCVFKIKQSQFMYLKEKDLISEFPRYFPQKAKLLNTVLPLVPDAH